MPDAPLTPGRRRTFIDPATIDTPARAPFVELGIASCFSFLRGASEALDLVQTAWELGYDAIGIADVNSMAGVVRIHAEAKQRKLRPVIGCRIETVEGLVFLAYPCDRAAYGRLCRLISAGRMKTLADKWQEKGICEISLAMLADHAEGVHLVLVPPRDLDATFTVAVRSNVTELHPVEPDAGAKVWSGSLSDSLSGLLPVLTTQLATMRHIAASYLYTGDDLARIATLDQMARDNGLSILATNDVLYHHPERRPLQDVMTAIRHKTTVAQAGWLLEANAERHLRSPEEMVRLFARWPHAIAAASEQAHHLFG